MRQPHGLPATVDLLHELQRVEAGIVDQVPAGALGIGYLQQRVRQGDQLLEIQGRADGNLVGIGGKVLGATDGVVAHLADIGDLEVDALLVEVCPEPAPVAEQPRLRRWRRLLGIGCASGEQPCDDRE